MVLGGDEGHQPELTGARFAALLDAARMDVVVSRTLDVYTELGSIPQLAVIVQTWTDGQITTEQLEGLRRAVAGGVGLAGWHGGIVDAFRSRPAYQFMTGGQWVAHPDSIIDYTVRIVPERRDHPIVSGLGEFAMRSEQYYMHLDPSNRVLATTTFGRRTEAPWVEGVEMPVVWTRTFGRGRVFVSTLGHLDADFEVTEAREITRRGLLWAAGMPADG